MSVYLLNANEDRIPFYEDFLKKSKSDDFLAEAKKFLEEKGLPYPSWL